MGHKQRNQSGFDEQKFCQLIKTKSTTNPFHTQLMNPVDQIDFHHIYICIYVYMNSLWLYYIYIHMYLFMSICVYAQNLYFCQQFTQIVDISQICSEALYCWIDSFFHSGLGISQSKFSRTTGQKHLLDMDAMISSRLFFEHHIVAFHLNRALREMFLTFDVY